MGPPRRTPQINTNHTLALASAWRLYHFSRLSARQDDTTLASAPKAKCRFNKLQRSPERSEANDRVFHQLGLALQTDKLAAGWEGWRVGGRQTNTSQHDDDVVKYHTFHPDSHSQPERRRTSERGRKFASRWMQSSAAPAFSSRLRLVNHRSGRVWLAPVRCCRWCAIVTTPPSLKFSVTAALLQNPRPATKEPLQEHDVDNERQLARPLIRLACSL